MQTNPKPNPNPNAYSNPNPKPTLKIKKFFVFSIKMFPFSEIRLLGIPNNIYIKDNTINFKELNFYLF